LQISERIKRMLKAQVLDLLELENFATPETSAQKDIDKALAIVRHELGQTLARKHRLTKTLPDAENALRELLGKAELAIAHDAEDLARAAVMRKVELEAHIADIRESISGCQKDAQELESVIRQLSIRTGQSTDTIMDLKNFEQAFEDLDKKTDKGNA